MSANSVARLSLWGGLVGLVPPLSLIAVFLMLVASKIALGEYLITALPVCALALLEFPPVCIGRACGLPIEAGGIAFITANLNGLGYTLMFVFWIVTGLLVGAGLGFLKQLFRRR